MLGSVLAAARGWGRLLRPGWGCCDLGSRKPGADWCLAAVEQELVQMLPSTGAGEVAVGRKGFEPGTQAQWAGIRREYLIHIEFSSSFKEAARVGVPPAGPLPTPAGSGLGRGIKPAQGCRLHLGIFHVLYL